MCPLLRTGSGGIIVISLFAGALSASGVSVSSVLLLSLLGIWQLLIAFSENSDVKEECDSALEEKPTEGVRSEI